MSQLMTRVDFMRNEIGRSIHHLENAIGFVEMFGSSYVDDPGKSDSDNLNDSHKKFILLDKRLLKIKQDHEILDFYRRHWSDVFDLKNTQKAEHLLETAQIHINGLKRKIHETGNILASYLVKLGVLIVEPDGVKVVGDKLEANNDELGNGEKLGNDGQTNEMVKEPSGVLNQSNVAGPSNSCQRGSGSNSSTFHNYSMVRPTQQYSRLPNNRLNFKPRQFHSNSPPSSSGFYFSPKPVIYPRAPKTNWRSLNNRSVSNPIQQRINRPKVSFQKSIFHPSFDNPNSDSKKIVSGSSFTKPTVNVTHSIKPTKPSHQQLSQQPSQKPSQQLTQQSIHQSTLSSSRPIVRRKRSKSLEYPTTKSPVKFADDTKMANDIDPDCLLADLYFNHSPWLQNRPGDKFTKLSILDHTVDSKAASKENDLTTRHTTISFNTNSLNDQHASNNILHSYPQTIDQLYSQLQNLQPVSNNSAHLSNLLTQIKFFVHQILSLSSQSQENFLVNHVYSKLPPETLAWIYDQRFQHLSNPDNKWTILNLLNCLDNYVKRQEFVEFHQFSTLNDCPDQVLESSDTLTPINDSQKCNLKMETPIKNDASTPTKAQPSSSFKSENVQNDFNNSQDTSQKVENNGQCSENGSQILETNNSISNSNVVPSQSSPNSNAVPSQSSTLTPQTNTVPSQSNTVPSQSNTLLSTNTPRASQLSWASRFKNFTTVKPKTEAIQKSNDNWKNLWNSKDDPVIHR